MHTIMMIEDDDAIRYLLERILEMEGYRVLLADDGIEGLRLISTMTPCRPSLILLDWRMPHMTGGELLARLHELGCSQRIVVFSASPETRREALRAGARRFLAKPFGVEELLRMVEELMDSPSAKLTAVRV